MRAMENELDMYKQQVDLFKSDIHAASGAMRSLRQQWVANQRRSGSGDRSNEGGGGSFNNNSTTTAWGSPSYTVAATTPIALEPATTSAVIGDGLPSASQEDGNENGKGLCRGVASGSERSLLDEDRPSQSPGHSAVSAVQDASIAGA